MPNGSGDTLRALFMLANTILLTWNAIRIERLHAKASAAKKAAEAVARDLELFKTEG